MSSTPPPSSSESVVATVAVAPVDCFGGDCFGGDCRVRMARGDAMIPIADVRRGDLVWTPDGPAAILYAVELRTKARSQPMSQIGALTITPWHPIRLNGEWVFPAHVNGFHDRPLQTVYNLVLSRGHVIDVEGVECVTLAHGFVEAPLKHDFFGTHAVVESMQRQPGFTEGRPVFHDLVATKDEAGVVNGWRDFVRRDAM